MKLMEYEGKQLFFEAGIPVPRGLTVSDSGAVGDAAGEIGLPVVVKAQVLSGGRGKRGGIKVVNSIGEAQEIASALFNDGLTGEPVSKVLVE
ncbi:MAG: ADP-forming succinate--CoA ligase subunit beta, partial [Dethiobacter sp.]|nr:ADP-forming succinate--CoA ligase subunit beta [Dethiobacter sp.]